MASASSDVGEIARRYALALYDVADTTGALDAVAADLTALRGMIAGSDDFKAFIMAPSLSRKQTADAAAALAKGAKFHALTANIMGVCAQNRRLTALDAIATAFLKHLAEKRGETEAKVTVARPLTKAQENALTDAVKQAVGAKATLSVEIDPSLLGGMIVKLGSKMFDSSLKTKLGRLQTAMKG